ncbi:TPA: glycosyltransferase, partial [Streptococcus suis]
MKVLQIAGSLKLGGQETVVMNIIRNQGRYCHHDVVIFDHYHGGYYPEALKYSSNIYELTSPTKNIFKFFLKFKRILKSTKYDIIHCHTYSSTGLVIILTKMLDRQVKFITHIHTDGSNNNNSLLKNCY